MVLGQGNQKFKLTWKLAFFVAACLTTAAAVLSILSYVGSFTIDPFNFVNQAFLLAFGLVMMALDIPPISHPAVLPKLALVRRLVYDNFLFMTRFLGRGVWYLFLGTLVYFQFWENDVSPFLGFFFSAYIIILAGVSIFFSVKISMKLDKIRNKLNTDLKDNRPHWGNNGLTKGMFLKMVEDNCPNQRITEDEWVYVHNAVELHPLAHLATGKDNNMSDGEEKLSKESIEAWVKGGMVFV